MPIQLKKREVKETRTTLEKFSDWLARAIGSWLFLIIHLFWFSLWFFFKLDSLLLTNIVSLEAILLVIVLLMASNRQIKKDEFRDEADYRTDLKAEREIAEVKKTIREIKNLLENKGLRKK